MSEQDHIIETFTEMASRYENLVNSELNRFWGISYLDFIKEQMRRGDWRNVIMTPSWHNHAGEGLNDRIAFGGRDAMVAWGRRFDHIDEFLTTVDRSYKTVKHNKHFVAELYTHWMIVDKSGLENVHILGEKTKRFPEGSPFWARRVRGGGRVHGPDLRTWYSRRGLHR